MLESRKGDTAMQTMQQVARAKEGGPFLEQFIEQSQPFILRAASKHAGFQVTKSDDEFSVSMLAFYEAIRTYDAENGSFSTFAYLVVGRRLTDYYRSVHRFDSEVPLSPQVFDGTVETESADAETQRAVVEKMAEPAATSAQTEITAANALFAKYGFTFYDLGTCSPKADKTRKSCAMAVSALLRTPLLLSQLESTHSLPILALSKQSGVSKKIIERHRKYIIAAALLLRGEYPTLSEYLQTIRREIQSCGQSL